jgi:hypothetical protein
VKGLGRVRRKGRNKRGRLESLIAVLISAPPIPVGLRGFQRSPVEWDRTPLDSTGLHWTPPDSTGLHRTPAESSGLRLENRYFIHDFGDLKKNL